MATEAELRDLAVSMSVNWEIIRGYSNEHSGYLPPNVEWLTAWGNYSGRRGPGGDWVAKHRASEKNDFDYANLAPWPSPDPNDPRAPWPYGHGDSTSCVRHSDGWPVDCPAGGVFAASFTPPSGQGATSQPVGGGPVGGPAHTGVPAAGTGTAGTGGFFSNVGAFWNGSSTNKLLLGGGLLAAVIALRGR